MTQSDPPIGHVKNMAAEAALALRNRRWRDH
jgi:hypothetical protein